MTKLHQILDVQLFQHHVGTTGNVRMQAHPKFPELAIYNYTEQCAYHGNWDEVTLTCRGLIVNRETGEVLARPFRKFFNYGQTGAPELALDAQVIVTDKLDGSLGILYRQPDGQLAIATRGSFASDQALHATQVLRERYGNFNPPPETTHLFEIIYPGNRIVLDYGSMDDLVHLGGISIESGISIDIRGWYSGWLGPKAEIFGYNTLAEALEQPPRPNAEGYVIEYVDDSRDVRLKIKQEDYVALHRILTGTSARTIWEYMAVNACEHLMDPKKPKLWATRLGLDPARVDQILAVGKDWEAKLLERVPDEFYEWFRATRKRLEEDVWRLKTDLKVIAKDIRDQCPGRADYARIVRPMQHFGGLFALYDNQDVTMYCWKAMYPEASRPFRVQPEETA